MGAARGVRCGQAIVGGAAALGLQIRAGAHAAEVELRDGDIAGLAVVIGKRISALGRPGEVLVSSTVKDLVTGSGLAFSGPRRGGPQGVPGTWTTCTVVRTA